MGKSATRPSLSVQNGACSRSAGKPVARKWRSSTSAYRTPASARSAASSGSQTRSVSHSPRVHPEAPLHRFVHPLDLLHAIRAAARAPARRSRRGESRPCPPMRRSQPVEVGGLVALEPLRAGPRGAGDRRKATAGEPIEQRAVDVLDVLGEHVVEVADRLMEVESENEADRRHVGRTPAPWSRGWPRPRRKDVGGRCRRAGAAPRRSPAPREARFGAGKECGEQGLRVVAMLPEPALGVVRRGARSR